MGGGNECWYPCRMSVLKLAWAWQSCWLASKNEVAARDYVCDNGGGSFSNKYLKSGLILAWIIGISSESLWPGSINPATDKGFDVAPSVCSSKTVHVVLCIWCAPYPFVLEWPMELASTNSNCSRVMVKARMLSVCGDHATAFVATQCIQPLPSTWQPQDTVYWTLFSVCMDCCCSLSAPNWASYKLHHSSLDWSAQQVVGSLRSYPDQDEERLASPEVPGAGAWGYIQCCWLLYDDRCGRSWNVFWCVAHEANETGVAVTPKQDTPVQETLLRVMSEAPWLTVLCCLLWKETWPMESSVLVISRVVVQWYKCYLSEVPYLCNLPLSLTCVCVVYWQTANNNIVLFCSCICIPTLGLSRRWILNLESLYAVHVADYIGYFLDNSCIFV